MHYFGPFITKYKPNSIRTKVVIIRIEYPHNIDTIIVYPVSSKILEKSTKHHGQYSRPLTLRASTWICYRVSKVNKNAKISWQSLSSNNSIDVKKRMEYLHRNMQNFIQICSSYIFANNHLQDQWPSFHFAILTYSQNKTSLNYFILRKL